jgi:hypothetical protein
MDCNSHPGKPAVGVCVSCGKLSAVLSAPDAVGRVKLAAGLFGERGSAKWVGEVPEGSVGLREAVWPPVRRRSTAFCQRLISSSESRLASTQASSMVVTPPSA